MFFASFAAFEYVNQRQNFTMLVVLCVSRSGLRSSLIYSWLLMSCLIGTNLHISAEFIVFETQKRLLLGNSTNHLAGWLESAGWPRELLITANSAQSRLCLLSFFW
jgi:hypothetical protein